jgi:hypothetical protein
MGHALPDCPRSTDQRSGLVEAAPGCITGIYERVMCSLTTGTGTGFLDRDVACDRPHEEEREDHAPGSAGPGQPEPRG